MRVAVEAPTLSRIRRLVRRGLVLVTLLTLMAPAWLGSATVPLLKAIGFGPEHRCACGMVPGKCGCPECARLEHQRQEDRAARPSPVVKSSCDENDPSFASASVPPGIMPAALALREPPGTVLLL